MRVEGVRYLSKACGGRVVGFEKGVLERGLERGKVLGFDGEWLELLLLWGFLYGWIFYNCLLGGYVFMRVIAELLLGSCWSLDLSISFAVTV